jgi:hypothetical protein
VKPNGERRCALARALALGLVGAGLLFSAAPACALRYVTKTATVGNGQSAFVSRDCPGNLHAVGGGIKGPKFMEQRVSSVGPFDDGDPDPVADDGWGAQVDGFVISELDLELFVTCGRGHYEYVHHLDFPIPAGTGLGVTSGYCVPGTRPLGGGGYASPPWAKMRVTSSRPLDGPDQDAVLDDAWVAGADTASGQTQYADATAICGEGDYEYVKASNSVSAGDQGGARVHCPGGTQLAGGGFAVTGATSTVALSSMFPRDGADPDRAPDDVWVARIDDLGGVDRTLIAYAVCKG